MEFSGRFRVNIFFTVLITLTILIGFSGQVHALQDGPFVYTVDSALEATVTGYIGTPQGDIFIPDKLDLYPVTHIESKLFRGCTGLTSIRLPSGVTRIDSYSFSGCTGLTKVILSFGLKEIGTEAFEHCTNLTDIKLPTSVNVIESMAFRYCASLPDIILPEGITRLDAFTFAGCTSLKNIDLPTSMNIIGYLAFAECHSLSTIIIPLNVTVIDEAAFFNCTGLSNIDLSGNLKEIKNMAFYGCSSLTSVDIPGNVHNVYEHAFEGCSSLKSIRFNTDSTYIFDNADTIPRSTTIIGYDPSTAKDYAKKYGNPFQPINDTPSSDDRALNEEFNFKPTVFNQELAERAALFSMLAYDGYRCNDMDQKEGFYDCGLILENGKKPTESKTLNTELILEKFTDIKPFYYCDDDPDNVSFVLAHKKVMYNGKQTDLTAVIIRGTDGVEWMGNMDVTGEVYRDFTGEDYNGTHLNKWNHWSFDKAKVDVKKALDQYLIDNQFSDSLVLVTGHSRGAAVANLLATDLTNDTTDSISDVFAYTFATPNVTIQPDHNKTNIFNFCLLDDFVPKVPLDEWDYGKNGILFTAIAQDAYHSNKVFESEEDKFVINSNINSNGASFNYQATLDLITYLNEKWPSTKDYYEKPTKNSLTLELTAHDYFKYAIAPVAIDPNLSNVTTLLDQSYPISDFFKIANFFVNGVQLSKDIVDNHQMFTYYSLLKNGEFKRSGIISGPDGSTDIGIAETDSISTQSTSAPTNANSAEVQKLKEFATQGDNLSKLGWSLDDVSTWNGVLWSDETANRVISLDLKFRELTGTLDLRGLSGLEAVDVSGNSLTDISLTGCNALTGLNCAYNELKQLDLTNLSGIRTLNCNGNQLQTLNINGCIALEELDCSSNQLADLNVSDNTVLTNLYCSNNNLLNLDLTANTLLTNFDCEGNYLDVQEGSAMYSRIQTILAMDGGWVSYEYQKIRENATFNSDDVTKLSAFANQGDNLSKLQWDLSNPSEWYGVEWVMVGAEYRVARLTLDNLDLIGSLNVSRMRELTSLSCNGNQLSVIDASVCKKLIYLSCYNVGAETLNIDYCPSLMTLECQKNFLDISVGTALKTAIDAISQKSDAIVNIDQQKIPASRDQFNAAECTALLDFSGIAGNSELLNWNADKPGEWAGVTWEKIDGEYRVTALTFNTKPVAGSLDLSNFGRLTSLDCSLSKISAVQLPSSMTTINANTFYDCENLTDVTLPESLTVIGDEAFYNCRLLKEAKLPESVTTIGEGAFAGCKSLTSMNIPSNTVSLGNYGFYECTALSTIQFNSSTTVIGDDTSTIPETTKIRGNDPSTAKDYAMKFGRIFENITPDSKLGDVDGNGSITAYDALMALQIATGKKTGTPAEITAADVDKSGSVQAFDALRILQYATGKITGF